jgi:hypothetical protein
LKVWQHDQQPEYTLTSLPPCPNNQDQLSEHFGSFLPCRGALMLTDAVMLAAAAARDTMA